MFNQSTNIASPTLFVPLIILVQLHICIIFLLLHRCIQFEYALIFVLFIYFEFLNVTLWQFTCYHDLVMETSLVKHKHKYHTKMLLLDTTKTIIKEV